jgi:aminoglycoside 3-N-acetyltransferase I
MSLSRPPEIRRLRAGDGDLARRLFAMMERVFEEEPGELGDAYLRDLLGREVFRAFAALEGDDVVGGLTAHVLPMTRSESSELFVFDLAVRADRQRRGVGRLLMDAARGDAAEIGDLFVPADADDTDALDFYRALGGAEAPAVIFTFAAESE